MKRVILPLVLVICGGCVATGAVEEQIQRLKSELNAERKQAEESIKNDYARDLNAAQEALRNDYGKKMQDLKRELDLEKEAHEKDMKDVNLTLIKIQSDFYDNRRVTEENTRRVYIIESLIAATRLAPEERTDGIVLAIKDGNITTNLGTKHGIKAGDVLTVFKDQAFKVKLATLRVQVAEGTTSKGELMEKSADVATGYFVKALK